ncbi:ABC transporter ATP-binding protein [Priestia koreensis]|uniref:ABC transporter ATP-binding protein n=1 Tax=Priestia koreensis TaxID=284581 RepID=UPI0020408574|nr:ABC transporter ATP-binding protein [Priestia koreensis]MCM3003153.1 ABC transporter ATP-binding protein [Priestia koreensis]
MLEVVNITKQYKKTKAVNGVNLFLGKGETVGLLGPNGAGKSTTISMISSLIPPTSGDIRVFNESILKKPQTLREILGIVPQEIAVYMELSAKENLMFFGRLHGLRGEKLGKKVQEVLEIIGLSDRQNDQAKTFSGGMKRRLNIGVALMNDPQIIIMDEPTVGIDPQSRNHILETVRRLNEEKQMTVLYTSHYMEEVEYLCDRIYIMDKGDIIASGTKDEIKNILSAENTIQMKVTIHDESFINLLKNHPSISNVMVQDKVVTVLVPKQVHILPELFKSADQCKVMITSVEVKTPTLEDVFLHLTGRQLRD